MAWAVGFIAAAVFITVAAGLLLRSSRPALVLITTEDCRRSFDDAGCRAIVEQAQSLHADTAPMFQARDICNFVYGPEVCAPLQRANIELHLFAPRIVAIALTRDRRFVLPLYLGRPAEPRADADRNGRPVYFRNHLVGFLARPSFGGAELPVLRTAAGDPITEADLRKLAGH